MSDGWSQFWRIDGPVPGYAICYGDTLVSDDWEDRPFVERTLLAGITKTAVEHGWEPVDGGSVKWTRTNDETFQLCPADGSVCWRAEGSVMVAFGVADPTTGETS